MSGLLFVPSPTDNGNNVVADYCRFSKPTHLSNFALGSDLVNPSAAYSSVKAGCAVTDETGHWRIV
jgi:hypothetical protein